MSSPEEPNIIPPASTIPTDPRAMEEWKQLQTIIGRLEVLGFQIRGWMLVLLGALIAALFAEKGKLTKPAFLSISLLIILAFCITELTTRLPKRESIRRSREVEGALRDGIGYNGPRIVASLTDGDRTSLKMMFREFIKANMFFFYVPLIMVIVIIYENAK